jgi:hypothetical protein
MKLVKLYAYGMFVVCSLAIACDCVGLARGGEVRRAFDFITLMEGLQLFWFFVSIAAFGFFISIKAPIKLPIVYSIYGLVSFVTLCIYFAVTDPTNRSVPLSIYVGDLFVTFYLIKLAVDLLVSSRQL